MSYSRLVELSENLTLDSYDEWDSLVKKLFSDSEIKLIRKNAILGFIDEVKYIKSRAKYLNFKCRRDFSKAIEFDNSLEDIYEQIDDLIESTFKKGAVK